MKIANRSQATPTVMLVDLASPASVTSPLRHETWHVIDWRDTGRTDRGEESPPADAAELRP